MSETDTMETCGLIGKMPQKGDFISRHLSVAFCDAWMEWCQAVIGVSHEQLDEQWLERYLTSPIWHFSLSAGVCGDKALVGTMIPSVDRAGRYFPLCLIHQGEYDPLYAYSQSDEWSEQSAALLLKVLDDDTDAEAYFAAVDGFDLPEAMQSHFKSSATGDEAFAPVINSSVIHQTDGAEKNDIFLSLANSWIQRQFGGAYSTWWTQGSEHVPPSLLVCNGMPPVRGFAAMLDGQWQKWGWDKELVITTCKQ